MDKRDWVNSKANPMANRSLGILIPLTESPANPGQVCL